MPLCLDKVFIFKNIRANIIKLLFQLGSKSLKASWGGVGDLPHRAETAVATSTLHEPEERFFSVHKAIYLGASDFTYIVNLRLLPGKYIRPRMSQVCASGGTKVGVTFWRQWRLNVTLPQECLPRAHGGIRQLRLCITVTPKKVAV